MDEDATYTLGEEVASAISHGIGAVGALAATPFLILAAAEKGAVPVVGACVFASSMILLYVTSTLYHSLPPNRAKRVFRVLDHSAIFLLIAGTYTPFTLGVLSGAWGWTLFGIVWSAAIGGIVLKSVAGFRYPRLSTVIYVCLGWVALLAVRPLWLVMPAPGWLLLIAGGLAYTGGVAFFAMRARYAHFVWHLCVLAGTACHYFAVLWYSA
jgi:hemolysin III